MNSLLLGTAISALLSTLSFLVVVFRVSPITSAQYALPSFFIFFFLMVSSVSTLLFVGMWKLIPHHTLDTGKLMSVSLREGIFTGLALCIMLLVQLLSLLNWWIAVLIALVFICIELALKH